jgi:hypothetical protein
LLKQIEKAFSDLGCFEMVDFTIETCADILTYLGYFSDSIAYKDRILSDSFKQMGGSLPTAGDHLGRNVSKRSFIVFVNAINNVFLNWMKGGGDASPENQPTPPPHDLSI